MHKAWLATITASICGTVLATAAMANPAAMAIRRPAPASTSTSIWPWSSASTSAPAAAAPSAPTWPVSPTASPAQANSPWPSAQISPWKHPVQYMQATFAEMPIGSKSKVAAPPAMPAAKTKSDAISLSVPTGPPSPEFFIFAAQMCERQGDIPQARQNLQRALAMWPGNAEVLRAAARMEDRQNNLPLAESLYQQAVAANPQNAAALNDLGLCLARQGKLEPSLQVIEQAIQQQPDKALYRNNAATVLVEMRQDQRALAHLAAVHNPADASFNLGQLLVERGRSADAAPYFQAALQQNPGMQQAQEALAKLPGSPVATAAPMMPVAAPQPQYSGPVVSPQPQVGPVGPQFSYPATATAQGPAMSGPSYVPPRYLPPVANQPGAVQR